MFLNLLNLFGCSMLCAVLTVGVNLFAQGMHNMEWSITGVLIAIVVICAAIGIMYVALRVFGITIPPWLVQIFWIVVVACVAIFAIKLVMSMW